jgi:hypothetical protein
MRRALLTAVLVPLFPVPATSFAETQELTQEDSIWHDDQLAEAEVRQNEKAAGIAPWPSDIRSNSATLDRTSAENGRVVIAPKGIAV